VEEPALEQRVEVRVERRHAQGLRRPVESRSRQLAAPEVALDALERVAMLADRRIEVDPLSLHRVLLRGSQPLSRLDERADL
jgi:hypothetical protein